VEVDMTPRSRLTLSAPLLLALALAGCATAPPGPPPEPSYTAIAIEHGRILEVEPVARPSNVPAGAMVGGLIGLIASGHHPGDKLAGMIAGAFVGGAVTAAAESALPAWMYTVGLLDGRTVRVVTEQPDLRRGDCVAVETDQFTNLRRVSGALCEPTPPEPDVPALAQRAQEDAARCSAAKEELLRARSRDEVDVAVRKVRVLCGT
jgi:outer membrane lipoprotein SlyB